jgi:hypothetical protein
MHIHPQPIYRSAVNSAPSLAVSFLEATDCYRCKTEKKAINQVVLFSSLLLSNIASSAARPRRQRIRPVAHELPRICPINSNIFSINHHYNKTLEK